MPSQRANLLTRSHRADLAAVAALVTRQARATANRASTGDIDAWFRRVLDELVALVVAGWTTTRSLSSRYLQQHAAVEGRLVDPILADLSTERVLTSLRVAGPVEFKRHMQLTGDPDAARATMARTLPASAQRLALAGERDTVSATVRDFGEIVGWRRVTDADPCAFCAMLTSRGAVYSKATVVFRAHDGDQCTAEPLYEHEDEPQSVLDLQGQWRRVTAGTSGAESLRAWRRYWDGRSQTPEGQPREGVVEARRQAPALARAVESLAPRNPDRLSGEAGDRWWDRLAADTDAPIPVEGLRLRSGYAVTRGVVHRRDGITYLVEDGTGDADAIIDGFREIHDSLPGEAGRYQQAYLWLARRNPADAYWEKQYNMPGFTSFAVAGDGSVTVWRRQGARLRPGYYRAELLHEFGHNVSTVSRARRLHDQGEEWAAAARTDDAASRVTDWRQKTLGHPVEFEARPSRGYPRGVTTYGKNSAGEDYAESVSLYLLGQIGTGRLRPDGPMVPLYFRDLFPARARILDQVFPQFARTQLAEIARLSR